MSSWYLSFNGERVGPLDDATARAQAAKRPDGHCWRQGMAEWLPIRAVPELASSLSVMAPPPPPSAGHGADDIDFRIVGSDMQFVEVELDPGESAIAEAGALMYKDASVNMDTVFGDGSSSNQGGGLMGTLLSAGKRLVTGESLFTTVFTHQGSGKAHVAFAAPYPGTVLAMKLLA